MTEGLKYRLMKLRTELAFLIGEETHGGPDRAKQKEVVRQQIRELEKQGEVNAQD